MNAYHERVSKSFDDAIARRRQWVADIVRERSSVRVSELSEMTGVSVVTIRQDLSTLEDHGQLQRVHGGARSMTRSAWDVPSIRHEHDWLPSNAALMVAAFVRSGDRIVFGPGPGLAAVAAALIGREDLTTVSLHTESLDLARLLAAHSERFDVTVPGGSVSPGLAIEPDADPLTDDQADLGFLECPGLSVDGMHADSAKHAEALRRTAFAARRVIAIAQPRAFTHAPEFVACSLDYLDACVTPLPVERKLGEQLRAAGVEVFSVR